MLLIAIPAVWFGGPVFALFVAAIIGVGWWELATMGRAGGLRPFVMTGGGAAVIIGLLAGAPAAWREIAVFGTVVALAIVAIARDDYASALADLAYSFLGVLWVGWLAGYAITLRNLPDTGLAWMLTAIAITIAADSGAYFSGRIFGRHALAPRVSPKKTVEGLIGGLAAAALAGALGAAFALSLPWWAGALVGVLAGAAAALGDLLESLVKRQLGVKDSSGLIPGHGGLLDRIDGLLFAIPVVVACVILTQSG